MRLMGMTKGRQLPTDSLSTSGRHFHTWSSNSHVRHQRPSLLSLSAGSYLHAIRPSSSSAIRECRPGVAGSSPSDGYVIGIIRSWTGVQLRDVV